jgi:anthranilate phosphoribosyltransferase
MSEILKTLIGKAVDKPLSRKEAISAFTEIMEGNAQESQIGGFLIALRTRGETIIEYTAAAKVMRAKCVKVNAPNDAIDIVGTGGDGKGTLNISTASALVVASAGVKVAKHGNKNLSSLSGAADILTELGVKVMIEPELVEKSIKKANIGFMMAPIHHPAVRFVMPARQLLGTRTIFNILGPLTNPAEVKYQLTGAFSKKLLVPMAQVLKELNLKRAWLVHGKDGTDELSISGSSFVVELEKGMIKEYKISPRDAGLPIHPFQSIKGGSPEYNAKELLKVFNGEKNAYRDAILLNSAAAFLISGKVQSLIEGKELAEQTINNGSAISTLKKLVKITSEKY